MNEKTETKPLKEITESLKEITESLEEFTESMDKTVEPAEKITDYYAKRWYDIGFRFAINYIYAHMLKTGGHGIIEPAAFKAYVKDALIIGVEDDYFVKHPFNDGNYPSGQCPGDAPGTCIQCADPAVIPIENIQGRR
jgi:hypothetical protein